MAVSHNGLVNPLSQCKVRHLWEQTSWDLLGKPLPLVIRVINGHVQHCLLQSLVLPFGVGLYHQSSPSLEASRSQSWDIRSFVTFLLHKVVFRFQVPKQP